MDSFSNENIKTNCHVYIYSNADVHSNDKCDCYTDFYSHINLYSDLNENPKSNSNFFTNEDGSAHCHHHILADIYTYIDEHRRSYSQCDILPDFHTHSQCNIFCNFDAKPYSDRDIY
jgi:hypothetical protein